MDKGPAQRIASGEAGIVDVRSGTGEQRVKGALVVGGRAGLSQRFSWLPPPGPSSLPLVVLVSKAEEKREIAETLNRWNVEVVVSNDDADFWRNAQSLHLILGQGEEDTTRLLFAPSPILDRAMSLWEKEAAKRSSSEQATLLDLGCGAGRDMAWAARRPTDSQVRWLVTGVDNLEATIRRVRLLASDLRLNQPHSSRIESIVWGQTTAEGSVDVFQGTLPHKTWDIILIVRFLPRSLLRKLNEWTHDGSLLALSHFVHGAGREYDSPPVAARLQPGEVEELIDKYLSSAQWSIISDQIDHTEDGRALRSVIARRKAR